MGEQDERGREQFAVIGLVYKWMLDAWTKFVAKFWDRGERFALGGGRLDESWRPWSCCPREGRIWKTPWSRQLESLVRLWCWSPAQHCRKRKFVGGMVLCCSASGTQTYVVEWTRELWACTGQLLSSNPSIGSDQLGSRYRERQRETPGLSFVGHWEASQNNWKSCWKMGEKQWIHRN